ncbi:MAG: diguanylate cyclase [Planctomycetota bacterium]
MSDQQSTTDSIDHLDTASGILASVSQVLSSLDEAPLDPNSPFISMQNQLASVRLGLASSLFNALRVRHYPTAAHCLRVAIGCSSWSLATEMTDSDRDEIEVAALLHDVGKVGAPDEILKQTTSLNADQSVIMDQTRRYSLQIISACCTNQEVLRIVAYAGAWYDGSRKQYKLKGDAIPIGARMLSIVDAFDAMTTNRVYRKAIPHDRAIQELFECSGTQFDPQLVEHFSKVHAEGRLVLDERATTRWLRSLSEANVNRMWQMTVPESDFQPLSCEDIFHGQLFDSISEGAFYLDHNGIVTRWNRSASNLTGLTSECILQQQWDPAVLKMKDATGGLIVHDNCPVQLSLATGRKSRQLITIRGGSGDFLQIDLQVVPVVTANGSILGVTVLMRDATSQINLEEEVQTLHKKATSDGLTGLANRAEFDAFHKAAIEKHLQQQKPCSLIICDIDRFKSINDDFGHQAGDEALVSFAAILQRACPNGDLVARYGGEEFVLVCENCNSAQATRLAEEIRIELSQTPLSELRGKCITASFGVTEIQPGDTPETMLRRADRGLLQAKDTGRNRVVQLGSGLDNKKPTNDRRQTSQSTSSWFSWRSEPTHNVKTECTWSTNVPLPLVAEKLRGFVADHKAEISTISSEKVVIDVSTAHLSKTRRRSDRTIHFRLEIVFREADASGSYCYTSR